MDDQNNPAFTDKPAIARAAIQDTVDHEFAHQFDVNSCNNSTGHHEDPPRPAWCQPFGQCAALTPQVCPMNLLKSSNPQNNDGTSRFCIEDLFLGDPTCVGPFADNITPGAIRTAKDPE